MSDLIVRKSYRTGRGSQTLPAVCSPEYHQQLAAQLWDKFIEEIGLQEFPDESLTLGNCPLCQTTLSRPSTKEDIKKYSSKRPTTYKWIGFPLEHKDL